MISRKLIEGAATLFATLVLSINFSSAHADVEIALPDYQLIVDKSSVRQQKEDVAREVARREQAEVDEELSRRGWPKSREEEARRLLKLKKEAAALAPRPGAGAALKPDANTQWEVRREEASNVGVMPIVPAESSTPNAAAINSSPIATSSPKSNCKEVDDFPKVAAGFSKVSEADARNIAITNTKHCRIMGDMHCMSDRAFLGVKEGKILKGDQMWNCRVSYHCGGKRQVCESRPGAASKQ